MKILKNKFYLLGDSITQAGINYSIIDEDSQYYYYQIENPLMIWKKSKINRLKIK